MRTMRMLSRAVLPAALLAAITVGACGGGDSNGDNETSTPGEPTSVPVMAVKSDVPRAAPDAAAMADTARALDLFAADLYAILAREDGNIVLSPYSIMVALAMTRAGATGETLEQTNDVLRAVEAGDLDAGLNAIGQELAKRTGEYGQDDDNKAKLELNPVNDLWGQRDFPFHDAFLDTLAADYGAGMNLVDYINAAEDARQTINAWVSEQTRGRIPELIPGGVLNEYTRLVLTNAIYLNAPWMVPFSPGATEPAPFKLLDGSTVEAQIMRLGGVQMRYTEGAAYKAVGLPYIDGSLAMLVVVPDEGQFSEFEGSFNADVLAEVVSGLQIAEVTLGFPRFEFRSPSGLKDALSEMGMPIAFEEELADFSGMSPEGKDFSISDVLHEAFISVDEEGTEAAAATAVIMRTLSVPRPVELTVDRPFMFFIRDNETGALLFMGRVLDPTK